MIINATTRGLCNVFVIQDCWILQSLLSDFRGLRTVTISQVYSGMMLDAETALIGGSMIKACGCPKTS